MMRKVPCFLVKKHTEKNRTKTHCDKNYIIDHKLCLLSVMDTTMLFNCLNLILRENEGNNKSESQNFRTKNGILLECVNEENPLHGSLILLDAK